MRVNYGNFYVESEILWTLVRDKIAELLYKSYFSRLKYKLCIESILLTQSDWEDFSQEDRWKNKWTFKIIKSPEQIGYELFSKNLNF